MSLLNGNVRMVSSACRRANAYAIQTLSRESRAESFPRHIYLEGSAPDRQIEGEGRFPEGRKTANSFFTRLGAFVQLNIDQTDWAFILVCDEDAVTDLVQCIMPGKSDSQALPAYKPADELSSDIQQPVPWDGHIPAFHMATGAFLGWHKPVYIMPARPFLKALWHFIMCRVTQRRAMQAAVKLAKANTAKQAGAQP